MRSQPRVRRSRRKLLELVFERPSYVSADNPIEGQAFRVRNADGETAFGAAWVC